MKIWSILLAFVLASCGGAVGNKNDDPLKNPFILYLLLDSFTGVKNSSIIDSVETNLTRLTSTLYQIESKGLDSPEAISYSGSGNFHSIDPENASADVGKALRFLAMKYASSPLASDITKIEGYLSYIERMQTDLSGGIGRGYVLTSVYNQFAVCSQDGTAVTGTCGIARYKNAQTINGASYRLRYDIDPGTMSNVVSGLTFVYLKCPTLSTRVKAIATSLRNRLIADSYLIKDTQPVTVKNGTHTRTNNPLSMLTDTHLNYMANNAVSTLIEFTGTTVDSNLATYTFGDYADKVSYNRNAWVMAMDTMKLYGASTSSYKTSVLSYNNALTAQITDSDIYSAIRGSSIKGKKDFPIQKWHCTSNTLGTTSVALLDRAGYDKWENLNTKCDVKTVADMSPNVDFLMAYWIN